MLQCSITKEYIMENERKSITAAQTSEPASTLAHWARQGMESFVATQKILLDLAAQQNSFTLGFVRERVNFSPQLDAARLRRGLAELESREPERAARVRQRVGEAVARQAPMADDDPCAALDPETGTCDLYAARPLTCRTFGPPVRCESGDLGVCELCFEGASDTEIAACEVEFDPDRKSTRLNSS